MVTAKAVVGIAMKITNPFWTRANEDLHIFGNLVDFSLDGNQLSCSLPTEAEPPIVGTAWPPKCMVQNHEAGSSPIQCHRSSVIRNEPW